jgi:hypothetical protein
VFLERASEHDLAAVRTRDLTLRLAPGLALKNPPKKTHKKWGFLGVFFNFKFFMKIIQTFLFQPDFL